MSGFEQFEQELYTSAEVLDETKDLAVAVLDILAGASGAGVHPHVAAPIQFAAWKLDPAGGMPGYDAGGRFARPTGSGFRSDAEFLEALWDAEVQVRDRLRSAMRLDQELREAGGRAENDLQRARTDLGAARDALTAAYAMPTRTPCEGCHTRKQAAIGAARGRIASAEGRLASAERRLGLIDATGDIVDPLVSRLKEAADALRQVPRKLGEEYELVYLYLERGGKLPKPARFITGHGLPA